MSPVDAAVVRRKLGHIADVLAGLGPLGELSLDEYRARLYERKATERLLQEGIEAALDVNAHLIAEHGLAVPDDYYGGFLMLATLHVLPETLARELAPSAGLRNRLVHEYEGLDDAKVLAAIGTMLMLYGQFLEAIETYLKRSGF